MTRKLFNAISFRIAIIFSLSTVIILMIMGLVIHQLVMHHFEAQDRTQLEGKIQLIENLLEQNPSNSQELNLYLKDALVGHHDLIVQIERENFIPQIGDTGKSIASCAMGLEQGDLILLNRLYQQQQAELDILNNPDYAQNEGHLAIYERLSLHEVKTSLERAS